jgi:hypothetical protein
VDRLTRSRTAHLRIDEQGFAWLAEDDFVGHFAADVDPAETTAGRMGATVVAVDSSHVAMVSHPQEVTDLIEAAVSSVS